MFQRWKAKESFNRVIFLSLFSCHWSNISVNVLCGIVPVQQINQWAFLELLTVFYFDLMSDNLWLPLNSLAYPRLQYSKIAKLGSSPLGFILLPLANGLASMQ